MTILIYLAIDKGKTALKMPRKNSTDSKGNHLNPTSCQSSDTSLVLESTTHSTSSPELTRHGTKQCTVNTPASQSDILHMIDQAAQSGSPKEMLECFNQLIQTENKVNQESLDQGLLLSCRYGREFLVQILIFHGANIETRDKDGNTPLLICAEKGFTDIALLLVDKGADINSYNKDGDTALLLSIKTSGSSELTRKLFDKKDLKVDHKNKKGYDALMKAIEVLNLSLMNILLKKKRVVTACCDFTVSDSAGKLAEKVGFEPFKYFIDQQKLNRKTTLQKAVLRKDKYLVKLLLASRVVVFSDGNGEDNNIVFEFLKSILESKREITEDDLDIVQILLKAGAPLKSDYCYNSSEGVLNLSIKIGSYNLIEMFCRHGADVNKQDYYYSNKNPLVVAAENGRCDIIDLLLNHGTQISQNSCPALQSAIEHEQLDCAKFLKKRGAKINASAALIATVSGNKLESFVFLTEQFKPEVCSQIRQIGTQLLNTAAEKGYKEMIRLLVQEGANVNASYDDKSPLMSTTDASVMELLIELGADVNMIIEPYRNSYSALSFIINESQRGRTRDTLHERVKVLLDNGADENNQDKLGNTPLMKASAKSDMEKVLRALLQAGADVNQQNNNGESALYFAANLESIANAKILLEFEADINLKNNTGQTPLFSLVSRLCMPMIKFMLENNANVNDVDNKGNTPLLHACSSSFNDPFEVARLLIKAGVSVNHQNNEGYTPLMLAAKQQHIETMKVLCEAGADVNLVNEKKNETALSALISNSRTQRFNRQSVLFLIEKGADSSCLSPDVIHQLILNEEFACLKQIITLGLGPKEVDKACLSFDRLTEKKASPIFTSLSYGSVEVARFLNDIWFLTQSDISLAYNKRLREHLSVNQYSLQFLDEYLSQPMSLQKLSFVVVSSAVGADAGRKARVEKLPIPKMLQDKLLFKHAAQAELAAEPQVLDIAMLQRLAVIHMLNAGLGYGVCPGYDDEYSSFENHNSDSDY
ncbi:ankyrin repeat and KH domain-containing protein mask-like [Physella acuta]|uniref:ankyrin repeat and KH domain-containing protein mask-like n=1 Tax=Physella acuta TaxID=109671 RepID=UPI0027DCEDB1|nr:ankyrin repeat and KH domain-containing protein mask-like [Physella acuta]